MPKTSFYIVNAITVYRLVAAFLLLYLLITKNAALFKWMLAISFLTDAVDGYLARRFGVVSPMGSRLDSIADDLTMLMGILGILRFQPAFLRQEVVLVVLLTALYLVQLCLALYRYGKPSSFHTYLAKAAAVLQAVFLILFFFLPEWPVWLFRVAAVVTAVQIIEEIILLWMLPTWQTDVKGLWWVWKKRQAKKVV